MSEATYVQCAECGTLAVNLDGHVHSDPARCIPICAVLRSPSLRGTAVTCPNCGDLWTLTGLNWNRTRQT